LAWKVSGFGFQVLAPLSLVLKVQVAVSG